MVSEVKNKENFSSQDRAEKYLISALEKEFTGRKFKVINQDKPWYFLNGKDQGTSLYADIEDQDGNVAYAGIDTRGQKHLWTDYMASYYIPKVAKPIEELLNQFDFVENYVITLDDWDEHDKYNNLAWSTKEFFENTRRKYQISVFLPSNQTKETYLEQVLKIYDAIYDKQDVGFDLEFIPIDKLFYGKPEYFKTEVYYGYYFSHQMNNHSANFRKDSKEMIEGDLLLNVQEHRNRSNWADYGVVWKKIPDKKSEYEKKDVYHEPTNEELMSFF